MLREETVISQGRGNTQARMEKKTKEQKSKDLSQPLAAGAPTKWVEARMEKKTKEQKRQYASSDGEED